MQTAPIHGESPDELIIALRAVSLDSPTLGIIFSSVFMDIPAISRMLETVPYPVAGCSSSGEILSIRSSGPVSELSATGCLMDPGTDSFRVSLFDRNGKDSYRFGEEIGAWGREQFPDPAFILLLSGLSTDGEAVMGGIASVFTVHPLIYGGMAGDDTSFEQTYVFTNGRYSTDGAVMIAFDRRTMNVEGMITSGWRGIGGEWRVTRAEGNTVYTLNDQPALDVYKRYLNLRDEDIPRLSIDFPLILRRADHSVVIRVPTRIDPVEHALVFNGSVPEGSVVTFSSSAGEEIITTSVGEITSHADRIRSADLKLLFSCAARYQAVGRRIGKEIMAAADIGDAPLVGFFSYGEIGNTETGRCEFHNETFTLVMLTQRREP